MTGTMALGTLFAGLGAGGAGWWWCRLGALSREDNQYPESEIARRKALRKRSAVYRWCEPLINDMAEAMESDGFVSRLYRRSVNELSRHLDIVEPPRPRRIVERWKPEEYLATKQLEWTIGAAILAILFWMLFSSPGALTLVGLAAFAPLMVVHDIRSKADRIRHSVRARLPMVLDLMALMLQSGTVLQVTVRKVAGENSDHPIGELFATLGEYLDASLGQNDALRLMAHQIDDPDVNEVVMTLTATGDTSGLSQILLAMSGPMRHRALQRIEEESEKANVQITWPVMLVMLGCLLIVAAVFMLPVAYQ